MNSHVNFSTSQSKNLAKPNLAYLKRKSRQPILFMLIGLPATGKSTWVKNFNTIIPAEMYGPTESAIVISTDNIIESIAKTVGMTYNEVFADTIKLAQKITNARITNLGKSNKDVIIDQTNLTLTSRAGKLNAFQNHLKIGIHFPKPEQVQWFARLHCRPGKTIPNPTLQNMERYFVYPTKEEGFDYVYDWTP
jgi:hypothetical protein